MKRIFTLTTLLFISYFSLFAQTTDVVTGVSSPWGIAFNGDELYITEAATGTISKINVTDPTPTLTPVVSGLDTALELVFNGNDLYINEFDAQKISKIDVTDPTPTPVDVITGIDSQTYVMQINENNLYYGEYFENKVSKIDISESSPTPVDVVTGLNTVSGLTLDGNILYICESEGNKISKIDISEPSPTPTDVITGLEDQPYSTVLYGNDLYILLALVGKIVKIDITETNPTPTDVVTGITLSRGMAIKDNFLYISDFLANKISKLELPTLDTTAPEITCPANITASNDLESCDAIITFNNATATDDEDPNPTVVQTSGPTSGSVFPIGETVIEYTATDNSGNSSTCAFTITVIDTEDPIVTCPDDITVMGDKNDEYIIPDYSTVTDFTDNCDLTLTYSQNPIAGEIVGLGETTINIIVTDDAGNETSCSFILTVDPLLGVKEEKLNDISFYPNPTTSLININQEVDALKIYNLQGQFILERKKTNNIDLTSLASGIYLVKIEKNTKIGFRRIVKF